MTVEGEHHPSRTVSEEGRNLPSPILNKPESSRIAMLSKPLGMAYYKPLLIFAHKAV